MFLFATFETENYFEPLNTVQLKLVSSSAVMQTQMVVESPDVRLQVLTHVEMTCEDCSTFTACKQLHIVDPLCFP